MSSRGAIAVITLLSGSLMSACAVGDGEAVFQNGGFATETGIAPGSERSDMDSTNASAGMGSDGMVTGDHQPTDLPGPGSSTATEVEQPVGSKPGDTTDPDPKEGTETSTETEDTTTTWPDHRSPLPLELELSGELPAGKVRIRFDKRYQDPKIWKSWPVLEGQLGDRPATFVDGVMKVQVPPPAGDDTFNGRKSSAIVVSLYLDRDQSGDLSQGDDFIASMEKYLYYTRPEASASDVTEWQSLAWQSQRPKAVAKRYQMIRIEDDPIQPELKIAGSLSSNAFGTDRIALMADSEYLSLKDNFLNCSRSIDFSLDWRYNSWRHTVKEGLAATRLETGPGLTGFSRSHFAWLVGYDDLGRSELTPESRVLAGLCLHNRDYWSRKKPRPAVGLVWVEPGHGWIADANAAAMVAQKRLRAGWNVVGASLDKERNIQSLYPLSKKEQAKIHIDRYCLPDRN